MTLSRISKPALCFAAIAALYLMMTLAHWLGVAHAGTEAAPPPAGWSLSEIMIILGLVGVVFGGLAALLHSIAALVKAVASRTATTVDDGVGDVIEGMADKLDQIAAHFPDPPRTPGPVEPHVAQSGRVSLALAVVMFVAAAAFAMSCAETTTVLKSVPPAVLDCTKQDSGPLLSAVLDLASQLFKFIAADGKIDWSVPGDEAIKQGTVIAECAYAEVRKAYAEKPAASIAHASAAPAPDAALSRLKAMYPGGIVTSHGSL